MMSYNVNSNWNDKNELRCLVIFKKLKCHKFPRGKQMYYCYEMSYIGELKPENISAKICNYKSVAGVNSHSNASVNTKRLFKKYGDCTIAEIEKIIATL